MSELLDSNTFGDKIYDRFPEMYKRDDKETGYQLKRFIQTAGEGFKCVIDEINGISDLRDSDKVDSSILPVIYASHGLEVFNGIPEPYLRNLIPLLNSLFSRKGSISAVDYLCSIISGVICTVDTSHFLEDYRIDILLDMDTSIKDNFPSVEQLRRIVKEFVPFYCNTSLVFEYYFTDSFRVSLRDSGFRDYVVNETQGLISVLIEDTLEEEEVTENKQENYSLYNNSVNENSNFLNNPRLKLTNNIFLNSFNGYDTITINGVTTIKMYNY